MSRYARPKRNIKICNADNFDEELVKSKTDVLTNTKNVIKGQTERKINLYIIPDFHYQSGTISNFISNNTLPNKIDSNMNFVSAGTYHIRYMLNLRPRIDKNLN